MRGVGRASRRLLEALVDLFLCEFCLLCGSEAVLAFPGRVCGECFQGFSLVEPAGCCLICAAPRYGLIRDRSRCFLCRPKRPPYRSLTVLGPYETNLAQLLRRLKYEPLRAAAIPIAGLLDSLVQSLKDRAELRRIDLILPMPLAPERLAKRGFNQAHELARGLPAVLGVALEASWARRRSGHGQVGRSASARQRLSSSAFVIDPRVYGRRVLMVDDVVTTTATMRAFGRALLEAGAMEVHALAAARTP